MTIVYIFLVWQTTLSGGRKPFVRAQGNKKQMLRLLATLPSSVQFKECATQIEDCWLNVEQQHKAKTIKNYLYTLRMLNGFL